MRLRIEHTTIFRYSAPISEGYTELRMKPLDGDGQRCLSFRLSTEPQEQAILSYVDRYGNDVRYVDVLQPHATLTVTALSDVATAVQFADRNAELSPLDAYDFLAPTAYVPVTAVLADLGRSCLVAGDVRASAVEIAAQVHRALTYAKGATHVGTPADEALQIGGGVCQDFSHVMLAACRSQGITSRYVSGYLFTRGMELEDFDEAATHAWVDVLVPGEGWISLDPTHNVPQSERHVRVAIGRDYADVPPTRGIFRGNAAESLEATVTIRTGT